MYERKVRISCTLACLIALRRPEGAAKGPNVDTVKRFSDWLMAGFEWIFSCLEFGRVPSFLRLLAKNWCHFWAKICKDNGTQTDLGQLKIPSKPTNRDLKIVLRCLRLGPSPPLRGGEGQKNWATVSCFGFGHKPSSQQSLLQLRGHYWSQLPKLEWLLSSEMPPQSLRLWHWSFVSKRNSIDFDSRDQVFLRVAPFCRLPSKVLNFFMFRGFLELGH